MSVLHRRTWRWRAVLGCEEWEGRSAVLHEEGREQRGTDGRRWHEAFARPIPGTLPGRRDTDRLQPAFV